MSVTKDIYVVHGCKFTDEFTHDLFLRPNYEELHESLVDTKEPWMLVDGMGGCYSFFGIIKKLDEEELITQFDPVSRQNKSKISKKFHEHFSDVEIPEIRTYLINHYK